MRAKKRFEIRMKSKLAEMNKVTIIYFGSMSYLRIQR